MNTEMNPWHPMTDPVALKHLSKLCEEAGELASASARCIAQGIDECEPITLKPNKEWLEDEIADVWANSHLVSKFFDLDKDRMNARVAKKIAQLKSWHDMA